MQVMAANRKKRDLLARAIVFGDAGASIGQLLAEAGVSEEEYTKFLGDGEFIAELELLSAHAAQAESVRVMKSLSELSKEGDPKVVRLYFDLLDESRRRCAEEDSFAELQSELWGDL